MAYFEKGVLTRLLEKSTSHMRAKAFAIIDEAIDALTSGGDFPSDVETAVSQGINLDVVQYFHDWVVRWITDEELTIELAAARVTFGVAFGESLPFKGPGQLQDQQQTRAQVPLETLLLDRSHEYRGYMVSYEEALAREAEYLSMNNKKGKLEVRDSLDFPNGQASQITLVQRLHAAIVDFSETIDNKHMSRSAKAKAAHQYTENTHTRRVRHCGTFEVELLAWKILYAIKDAQDGKVMIGPWSEDWRYATYPTFLARFEDVERTLKSSKAATHSLIQADHLFRLVSAPGQELQRKKNNKGQNALRDIQVKAGINALSKGDVKLADDLGLVGEDGEKIAPAHPIAAQLEDEMKQTLRQAAKYGRNPRKRARTMETEEPDTVDVHQTAMAAFTQMPNRFTAPGSTTSFFGLPDSPDTATSAFGTFTSGLSTGSITEFDVSALLSANTQQAVS